MRRDGNGVIDDRSGWDVADGDPDVEPPVGERTLYHGTHIASIVTTIARMRYGERATEYLRILPVKSISDGASSTYLHAAWEGLDYAVNSGADSVLTAWNMHAMPTAARAALARAEAEGVLVIGSTSNFNDQRPYYPAAADTVLAVSAVEGNNAKARTAAFGQYVDVAAPGVAIPGADVANPEGWNVEDSTSFSTALVGAVAALVKLDHPDLAPAGLRACLVNTAALHTMLRDRYLGKLGAGILDPRRALQCDLGHGDNVIEATTQYLSPDTRDSTQSWTVRAPGRHKGQTFRVRYPGETPSGVLEFTSPNQPKRRYSFEDLPSSVRVRDTEATLTFMPAKGASQDWHAVYEAEAIDFTREHCHGLVNVTEPGILSDGSGPAPYAWNSSCKWQVTAPEGKVVRFEFDTFATEPNRDLLYFFDGGGTQARIIAILSGNRPPAVTSWRNTVHVWFVTDAENQRAGWRARVAFIDNPARAAAADPVGKTED